MIPNDALSAGYNTRNGTTYYIAQILHENSLVPGEINDSDKKAYYEWDLEKYEAADENVKVKPSMLLLNILVYLNSVFVDFLYQATTTISVD